MTKEMIGNRRTAGSHVAVAADRIVFGRCMIGGWTAHLSLVFIDCRDWVENRLRQDNELIEQWAEKNPKDAAEEQETFNLRWW